MSRSSTSDLTTPKFDDGNHRLSRPGKYGMLTALTMSPSTFEAIGTIMRDPMGVTHTPTPRFQEICETLSPRKSSFSSPTRRTPMLTEIRCVVVAR